jgi:hypothetical protein
MRRFSCYGTWWKITIGKKTYCYRGPIDNAIFSAVRRHNFPDNNKFGKIKYQLVRKPFNVSMAAFVRKIEGRTL